jgi:hypothetical protein
LVQPLYGSENTAEIAKIYAMLERIEQQVNDAERIELMGKGAAQALKSLLEGQS